PGGRRRLRGGGEHRHRVGFPAGRARAGARARADSAGTPVSRRLLILGAGGHGRAVADLAAEAGWTVAGFTDRGSRAQVLGTDREVGALARAGTIDAGVVGGGVVAGGAVVVDDVPPGATVIGVPARAGEARR